MKKILTIFLATNLVVALLVGVLLFAWPSKPPSMFAASNQFTEVECPFGASGNLSASGAKRPWLIYFFDGVNAAPKIGTMQTTRRAAGSPVNGTCRLEITSAPQRPGSDTPGEAVDWRIGQTVNLTPAPGGRRVTYRVFLRADRDVTFDSASIYLYDGKAVAATGFQRLTTEWQTVTVDALITPDIRSLEVWVRLVYGKGTIIPGDAVVEFAADIAPSQR